MEILQGTARYSMICSYTGPNAIPDGDWLGANFSGSGTPHWQFVVETLLPVETFEEALELRGQAREVLRRKADSIEAILNLELRGHYQILSRENGGVSANLADGSRPMLAERCFSVSSAGPVLTDEQMGQVRAYEFVTLREGNRALRQMVDSYLAGKKLKSDHPRLAFLCFYQVLEIRAWLDQRQSTDASIPDYKIRTRGEDVVNVWNDYCLQNNFPGVVPSHIQQNIDLVHSGIQDEHPVLTGIRVARNKRLIGHGVPSDPLPNVRLPLEEAEHAAKSLIIRYTEELEQELN